MAGAYDVNPSAAQTRNANFRFLRSALSSAASSFAAPSFLASSQPISEHITAWHNTIAPDAQVFATQIGRCPPARPPARSLASRASEAGSPSIDRVV